MVGRNNLIYVRFRVSRQFNVEKKKEISFKTASTNAVCRRESFLKSGGRKLYFLY